MKLKFLLLSLCCFSFFAQAHPWHKEVFKKQYSKQFILQHAGIGSPTHWINGRIQPGIEIALEKYKPKKHYVAWRYALGYSAQRSLQRAIYFKPSLQYHWTTLHQHITLKPHLDLACLLVRQTNKEFRFEQGVYNQVNPYRMQFMPNVGLDIMPLTFKIKKRTHQLLLGYALGLQLPFSSLSSILPINQIRLGLQIQPSNSSL